MTAEEIFRSLFDKYHDFNWHIVQSTRSKENLVEELKKELGDDSFFSNVVHAVAKCDSNDDVLYLTYDDKGNDIYYIFHLTYSSYNPSFLPTHKKFLSILEVKEYIEQLYIKDYL